jgi:hypothetical protein
MIDNDFYKSSSSGEKNAFGYINAIFMDIAIKMSVCYNKYVCIYYKYIYNSKDDSKH